MIWDNIIIQLLISLYFRIKEIPSSCSSVCIENFCENVVGEMALILVVAVFFFGGALLPLHALGKWELN